MFNASRKFKQHCPSKASTPPYNCKCKPLHKCNWRLDKQESQLFLEWADRTAEAVIIARAVERKRFPSVTAVPYTLWWRCYTERYNQQWNTIR